LQAFRSSSRPVSHAALSRDILVRIMTVIISLLRGINVGGHNKIKMDALRDLYTNLGLLGAQTLLQSGNVVFRMKGSAHANVAKRIEDAIEKKFGFRIHVVSRTSSELSDVISRCPFAKRKGLDPAKLAVIFLKDSPSAECLRSALKIETAPEELHIDGREAFAYFPNGMGRPKMSWPAIERALKTSGTNRNWNTVTKLLELAQAMESSA